MKAQRDQGGRISRAREEALASLEPYTRNLGGPRAQEGVARSQAAVASSSVCEVVPCVVAGMGGLPAFGT